MWVALCTALVGLAIVAQVWEGLTLDPLGVAFAVGAMLALCVYYISADIQVQRPDARDPVSLTMWGMGAAALFWAIVQPSWTIPARRLRGHLHLFGDAGPQVPATALAAWMVVLGTVVPFSLVVVSMQHLRASQASAVGMTEPIFATAIAWIVLGEALDAGADRRRGDRARSRARRRAQPRSGTGQRRRRARDGDLDDPVHDPHRVVAEPADPGQAAGVGLRARRIGLRLAARAATTRARTCRPATGRPSSASGRGRPSRGRSARCGAGTRRCTRRARRSRAAPPCAGTGRRPRRARRLVWARSTSRSPNVTRRMVPGGSSVERDCRPERRPRPSRRPRSSGG